MANKKVNADKFIWKKGDFVVTKKSKKSDDKKSEKDNGKQNGK